MSAGSGNYGFLRMMSLPAARAASALLLGALALGAGESHAQGLEAAACQAFAGAQDCRTVAVVDAEQCIVKVRPKPLPELDPAVAGCLIDEIGTRQVFLKNARDAGSAESGGADGTGTRTRVRFAGPGVVQELTGYDEAGAPVWQARDEATFEHEGSAAPARAALAALASGPCGREAETADATAAPGPIPRAIDVEEAYRLSQAGHIVLIDVRLESEWRKTGIAETAVPITMHQRPEDFISRLGAAAEAAGGAPVALICARGNRSAYLQRALKAYGLDGIIDVTGGMLGGNGAPGWIPAGLPVKPYEAVR